MEKVDWRQAVIELYDYFGSDKLPTTDRILLLYKEVATIPLRALNYAMQKIKDEFNSLPRNIPKQIKIFYFAYRSAYPEKVKIKYDNYNDPRYPIENLQKAFKILTRSGTTEFMGYVNQEDMPQQDIERVLNKQAYRTNPEFKDKISAICKNIKEHQGIDFEQWL